MFANVSLYVIYCTKVDMMYLYVLIWGQYLLTGLFGLLTVPPQIVFKAVYV